MRDGQRTINWRRSWARLWRRRSSRPVPWAVPLAQAALLLPLGLAMVATLWSALAGPGAVEIGLTAALGWATAAIAGAAVAVGLMLRLLWAYRAAVMALGLAGGGWAYDAVLQMGDGAGGLIVLLPAIGYGLLAFLMQGPEIRTVFEPAVRPPRPAERTLRLVRLDPPGDDRAA